MAEENKIPEMDWANEMKTDVVCSIENPNDCLECGS